MHYRDYVAISISFRRECENYPPDELGRFLYVQSAIRENQFRRGARDISEGEETCHTVALHAFHSVERTTNNFVTNCIKLSGTRNVACTAAERGSAAQ